MNSINWIKIRGLKKISFTFFLILQIFILRVEKTYSKDFLDFELHAVYSDAYFFNVEKFGSDLILGSDKGVYQINSTGKISLIDPLKKGYVYIENKNITNLPYSKIGTASAQYNELIPSNYRNPLISGEFIDNLIVVISKGKCFVFKKMLPKKASTLSVRAISKNYIGTYDGIFFKNELIPFHSYTNGFIREFETEAFICFDGLTRISNNKMQIFDTNEDWKTALGNIEIREVRDILKLNNQSYLLFNMSGILETNLKGKSRWIHKNTNEGEPKFISIQRVNNSDKPQEIIFIQNRKIYNYNLINQKVVEVFEIDNELGPIRDIAYSDLGKIYLVTLDKLLILKKNVTKGYSAEIIDSNLVDNHHLIWLKDKLLITSNAGMSVFNTRNNILSKFVIKDEFNDKAFYQNNDSIFLGTPSGYYSFSNSYLDSLTNSSIPIETEKVEPIAGDYKTPFIITSLLLFALIFFTVYQFRNHKELKVNQLSKKKIVDYIDLNLSTVTVISVTEYFNTNFNAINNELKTIKIGELIRERRILVVRNMREKRINEETISIATGFSISYLKKIK